MKNIEIQYIDDFDCNEPINEPVVEKPCNDCWNKPEEPKEKECKPCKEKKTCECHKTETKCNKTQCTQDCSCDNFKVSNYFSELIHDWEKETARYNLGIQELENIEYVTVSTETGEQLTKVIFKYRLGRELITREFYVAPKGDKGDSFTWKDLTDEQKAMLKGDPGLPGKDGDSPELNKVEIVWMTNGHEYGEFVKNECSNSYNLILYLNKPDSIAELSRILEQINAQLVANYVTKDYLNTVLANYATRTELLNYVKVTDINNYFKDYSLRFNSSANILYLLKDGIVVSTVTLNGGGGSVGFSGQILVFKKTNSATNTPTIYGSDYRSQGWDKYLPDIETEGSEFIWMATCEITNGTWGTWSVTRLTGLDGVDGVDSNQIQYIYKRTSTNTVDQPQLDINTEQDAKPLPTDNTWLDHPVGVTTNMPYEWFAYSVKKSNNRWSDFSVPGIWSHYGQNGHDGDGFEYIFTRTTNRVTPNPNQSLPSDYETRAEVIPTGWTDNPRGVNSQYRYEWVSTRKSSQGRWSQFSIPTVWNEYKEVASSDPNYSVNFDPALVVYPSNGSKTTSVNVRMWYGTEPVAIVKILDANNNVVATTGDQFVKTISYTANASSSNLFKVYFSDSEYREATLTKTEVSTAGTDAQTYSLYVNPSTITFDNNDVLKSNFINFDVLKYVGSNSPVSIKNQTDATWKVVCVDVNGVSHERSRENLNSFNIASYSNTWYNGQYFTLTLYINNIPVEAHTIPVIKNAQSIASSYVIRQRGKYNPTSTYVNDTLTINTGTIKYIDAVTTEIPIQGSSNKADMYIPKVESVTGVDPAEDTTNTYWQVAYQVDFAYIHTLIADIIRAESLQAAELLISSNGSEIVAGMTSGNRLNPTDETNAVRIWAGTSQKTKDTLVQSDLTTAPFRVYGDGRVVAENIQIFGNGALALDKQYYAYNSHLNLPDAKNGQIGYLIVTDGNNYTISSTCRIHGNDTRNSNELHSVTTNGNGVYIVVGYASESDKVWAVGKTNIELLSVNSNVTATEIQSANVSGNDLTCSYNVATAPYLNLYGNMSSWPTNQTGFIYYSSDATLDPNKFVPIASKSNKYRVNGNFPTYFYVYTISGNTPQLTDLLEDGQTIGSYLTTDMNSKSSIFELDQTKANEGFTNSNAFMKVTPSQIVFRLKGATNNGRVWQVITWGEYSSTHSADIWSTYDVFELWSLTNNTIQSIGSPKDDEVTVASSIRDAIIDVADNDGDRSSFDINLIREYVYSSSAQQNNYTVVKTETSTGLLLDENNQIVGQHANNVYDNYTKQDLYVKYGTETVNNETVPSYRVINIGAVNLPEADAALAVRIQTGFTNVTDIPRDDVSGTYTP